MSLNIKNLGLLVCMLLTIIMVNIDVTGMYVLLDPIAHSLHLSTTQVGWVASVYLLAFGTVIVIGGRLGDLYGNRNTMLLGLSIFLLASVLGAYSHNFSTMFISRFVQGLGAGLVWPNTTAIILSSMPARYKGLAAGILSGAVGVGLAAGPLITGAFSSYLNWRWVFWFNVPMSLFIIVLVMVILPNKQQIKKQLLDYPGAVLLALALAALILSFQLPWFLLLSAVMFILFVAQQKKAVAPIVPMTLVRNRMFITACVLRFFTVIPFYVTMMSFGLYFQQQLHLSAFHTGLAFLPMMLAIGILSPIGGVLIDKWGAWRIITTSMLLSIMGCIWVLLALQGLSAVMAMCLLLFPGLAFTLSSPAALSLGIGSVSDQQKASASGVFYMVSVIGGLVGTSLCSALIRLHNMHAVITQAGLADILWVMLALSTLGLLGLILFLALSRLSHAASSAC